MPTAKPTVTDEHKKKYEELMKIPIKSVVTPLLQPTTSQNPAQTSTTGKAASSISAILASIPKPKGIGNKMFIFTGKKKIIMDGVETEIQKINTVDAAKNTKKTKEEKEKEKKERQEGERQAKEAEKEAQSVIKKMKSANGNEHQKSGLPRVALFVAVILFIIAWAAFWAAFFGFIKLW